MYESTLNKIPVHLYNISMLKSEQEKLLQINSEKKKNILKK